MSNLAHDGDDYPDAAGKNLDDALALLAANRFDGAGYLAGYVVECSLKTLIVVQEIARHAGLTEAALTRGLSTAGELVNIALPGGHKQARLAGRSPPSRPRPSHHDLEHLSRVAVACASQPGAATQRYAPPAPTAQSAPPDIYGAGWKESLRYASAGAVDQATALKWIDEAKSLYQTTVARMRRDGVVFP